MKSIKRVLFVAGAVLLCAWTIVPIYLVALGGLGGEQIRFIRFEGNDLLHIESPPMPHPNLAGKVVRVIVTWQRDT